MGVYAVSGDVGTRDEKYRIVSGAEFYDREISHVDTAYRVDGPAVCCYRSRGNASSSGVAVGRFRSRRVRPSSRRRGSRDRVANVPPLGTDLRHGAVASGGRIRARVCSSHYTMRTARIPVRFGRVEAGREGGNDGFVFFLRSFFMIVFFFF